MLRSPCCGTLLPADDAVRGCRLLIGTSRHELVPSCSRPILVCRAAGA